MEPQERFDLFLAYLESPKSLRFEEVDNIIKLLARYQPLYSDYLPEVSLPFLNLPYKRAWNVNADYEDWRIKSDQKLCMQLMKSLFYHAGLKASVKAKWKIIIIPDIEYFIMDLAYSKILNHAFPQTIYDHTLIDKKHAAEYMLANLNKVEAALPYFSSFELLTAIEINNFKNIIGKIIIKIKSRVDKINNDYKLTIMDDYKAFNIVSHLYLVLQKYASTLNKDPLCKRIEEVLKIFYPDNPRSFYSIKKHLQRHKFI